MISQRADHAFDPRQRLRRLNLPVSSAHCAPGGIISTTARLPDPPLQGERERVTARTFMRKPLEQDDLYRVRHSAAHVLAQAVSHLFPEAKMTIGPPTEEGFYYDFDRDTPFTPEDLVALEHAGLHGSHASDMQSVAFTPASAIAALFAATGQDLGMVGTSSMAHEILERTPDGVQLAIRLPGVEVGTIGGGAGLPHAQAYLSLLRCQGPGSAYRLAQIVAAATLCLELSASAAMASAGSENFAMAHLRQSGRG